MIAVIRMTNTMLSEARQPRAERLVFNSNMFGMLLDNSKAAADATCSKQAMHLATGTQSSAHRVQADEQRGKGSVWQHRPPHLLHSALSALHSRHRTTLLLSLWLQGRQEKSDVRFHKLKHLWLHL